MLNSRTVNSIAVLALVTSGALFFVLSVPVLVFISILAIWITITVIGSFHIRWNYHVEGIHSAPEHGDRVSLTFDDGPHPEYTPKVLDVLDSFQAKATFFLIGREMAKYPELVLNILERGHSIGNHSHSHDEHIGFFSKPEMREEILWTNQVAKKVCGKELKIYRPPFGVTNPNIASAIRETGMITLGWSIRSLDTTKRSTDEIIKHVKSRMAPGAIILLHDNRVGAPYIVEQLLLFLTKQGLRSVTADEILEIQAYA